MLVFRPRVWAQDVNPVEAVVWELIPNQLPGQAMQGFDILSACSRRTFIQQFQAITLDVGG